MRKGLTLVLMIVMLLTIASPVGAQGSGPGPMEPPAGEQQGPGAPPEAAPVGPRAPAGTPEPVRTQAGDQEQTRTQVQECLQDQGCLPEQDRLQQQDRPGSDDSVDPLMTRQQLRMQICEKECTPASTGLMTQVRTWLRARAPALVQQRLFGVTPFSMSGTAEFDEGDFVFTFEDGNRWADELWVDEPVLVITDETVIKAVYPVTNATAEIIHLDTLKEYLEDCSTSDVMIFGYVEDDGDFVATRIQIRVLCALD